MFTHIYIYTYAYISVQKTIACKKSATFAESGAGPWRWLHKPHSFPGSEGPDCGFRGLPRHHDSTFLFDFFT